MAGVTEVELIAGAAASEFEVEPDPRNTLCVEASRDYDENRQRKRFVAASRPG